MFLSPAHDAFAGAQDGQGYFTAMASYIDDDEQAQLDDGISGGQFGFGRAFHELWNIEGYVMFASPDGSPGQDQTGLGADMQLVFNRSTRFAPYLFVGAGYLSLEIDGNGDRDGLMLAGGAGFVADIFGDSDIALRGEYRQRGYDLLGEDFRDNMFSLGLQFPFGSAAPAVVDTDGDGVPDSYDRCPGTAPGTAVDEFGCAPDSDGDGVVDMDDRCPDTPAGVRVNREGCPPDSDGDGVHDDADRCPNTARGVRVGADGCEPDEDSDGVVDRLDRCPGTPRNTQVDVRGCEIREEIELPGVNFETNSDRLLAGAESELDAAAATLRKNPGISVEVAGHTDSDGAADYNEGLSSRRATTVRDYLAAQGIAESRLTIRGYGESQPIADNATRDGKAQNRRVVLRVLER
jgi:OOP family OmpA-OmpF porin